MRVHLESTNQGTLELLNIHSVLSKVKWVTEALARMFSRRTPRIGWRVPLLQHSRVRTPQLISFRRAQVVATPSTGWSMRFTFLPYSCPGTVTKTFCNVNLLSILRQKRLRWQDGSFVASRMMWWCAKIISSKCFTSCSFSSLSEFEWVWICALTLTTAFSI